jgi:hypothetical protein
MSSPRIAALIALLASAASAQWINYKEPGAPRTADGKVNLTAPAPRAFDNKPDLSGLWFHDQTPLEEMQRLFGKDVGLGNVPGMEIETVSKYALNLFADFKPADAPIRPKAIEVLRQRKMTEFPPTHCLPTGIPFGALVSEPIKIVQAPKLTLILFEGEDPRQIHTDGRELPKEIVEPQWLGYSVGKWDGDTFVVETAGFNDKSWLDGMGHPHSEALHVIERFHRRDFGHMDIEMTFEDPEFYTKPFTVKVPYHLLPDADIFEYICNENEKDLVHMKAK